MKHGLQRQRRYEASSNHDGATLRGHAAEKGHSLARRRRVAPWWNIIDDQQPRLGEQGGREGKSCLRTTVERVHAPIRHGTEAGALEHGGHSPPVVAEREIA